MKSKIADLIAQHPERQFNKNSAMGKAKSLFGNSNSWAVGMGMGNKLGAMPTFMNCKSKHGYGNYARATGGM